jgi:hypothetical protein
MKKPLSKAKNGIEQFDDVVQPKSLYIKATTPTRTRPRAKSKDKSTMSPYDYDSESEELKKGKTKQGNLILFILIFLL